MPSFVGHLLLRKLLLQSVNITVSNVRGPDVALYLAGAKAMCFYPVSIPTNGAGLNLTGVSYNRVMWLSAVSCREMIPDPGFFTQCMKEAWEELLAAADALPAVAAQAAPAAARASAKTPASNKPAAAKKPAVKASTSKASAAPKVASAPKAKPAVRKPAAASASKAKPLPVVSKAPGKVAK